VDKIKINKSEAARRQLDAAIRMLFNGEDPIAIYTLAMAGFRVLQDLASKQDISDMEQAIKTVLGAEDKGIFHKKIRSDANFLKHADQDPDGIHDGIEEEANDWVLFLASLYYQELGNSLTPEMYAFIAWLSKIHPDAPKFLLRHAKHELRVALDAIDNSIGTFSRGEQLALGSELLKLSRRVGDYSDKFRY